MHSARSDMSLPEGGVGPGARLKFVRQELGLSQKELSARLGLSQSTLSQIENDKYYPNFDSLLYLVAELGVDSNWLLAGRGSPYGVRQPPVAATPLGYPAVIEKARAGYAGSDRDEHWVSQLTRYEIPGFRPDADIVIFQVLGDSMLPTLEDQDYVLGERIVGTPESFCGQAVVTVVQDEIYVKRLANYDLVLDRLTLSSDNPKYPTIDIAAGEALEIWHVVGRITRHLAPTVLSQDFRIRQLEAGVLELRAQVADMATRLPSEHSR